MSNTSALVPYLFEGHRIRVSTDQQGEAWIVVADACAALAESPMVWARANRREEEHCLHSEEGPGAGGFTLALINEAALLRRLLNSDNPSAPRMRRWLTNELLPALQRRQEGKGELPLPRPGIDAIRRQIAAEVLRGADEIIQLTGVSHAEALLSVLEEIQAKSSPSGAEAQQRFSHRAGVAWLTADQLADDWIARSATPTSGSLPPSCSSATRTTTGSSQKPVATGASPCRSALGESATSRSSGIRPWWPCCTRPTEKAPTHPTHEPEDQTISHDIRNRSTAAAPGGDPAGRPLTHHHLQPDLHRRVPQTDRDWPPGGGLVPAGAGGLDHLEASGCLQR